VSLNATAVLPVRAPGKRLVATLLATEILAVVLGIVFPGLTLMGLGAIMGLAFLVVFVPTRPEIFYTLVIATSALDYFGTISSFGDYSVTCFHVALLLTIVSYVTHSVLNRRWEFPSTGFNAPFLAFWGLAVFSLFYSADPRAGAIEVVRLLFLGVLFFLTVLIVRSKPKMQWMVFLLLLTVVAMSVIATYQLVANKDFLPSEFASRFGHGVNRSEGTFANANWLAAFVMIGTIVGFSFLLNYSRSPWKKLLVVGVVASSTLALLASFSRSGWLSVAVGIALVAFLSGKLRSSLRLLPLVLLCILVLLLMFPHPETYTSRLTSMFELGASNASRIYLAISGLWIFLDHPLLGVGLRSFPAVYQKSYIHPDMPLLGVVESHTLPIEVLAELGIVGFLLLIWLFYSVVREASVTIRTSKDGYLRALQIGLLSSFLALMVNNLFSNNLGDNFLWIVMGLIFAARRIAARSDS